MYLQGVITPCLYALNGLYDFNYPNHITVNFNIVGHQYCKPRLKELCRYSEDVTNCWAELGLELDLPLQTVETLDIDYTRTKEKCRRMFVTWLERSPDPCWCEVVKALEMIKMLHLATEIEAKYLGMLVYKVTYKFVIDFLTKPGKCNP